MSYASNLRHAKELIVNLAQLSERTPYAPPVRPPAVLELPAVQVTAVTAKWCIAGQVVTPGQTYTVSAGDAARLEAAGKARRA